MDPIAVTPVGGKGISPTSLPRLGAMLFHRNKSATSFTEGCVVLRWLNIV